MCFYVCCAFVLCHLVVFHVVSVDSVLKISLIIACIIGVIAYRLAVYAAFASIMKDSATTNLQVVGPYITPQLATSVTASCINFVIIMILNLMYEKVAVWITDMGESQNERACPRLFYVSITQLLLTLSVNCAPPSFIYVFKSYVYYLLLCGRDSQNPLGVREQTDGEDVPLPVCKLLLLVLLRGFL